MNVARGVRLTLPAVLLLAAAAPARALPTMIRLGYPTCVSCHLSPQGGGPLNIYGRGIDEAQSRRAGEYKPPEAPPLAWSLWGRVTQDVRATIQDQGTWAAGRPGDNLIRPRVMYRNVTALGAGFRASATVSAATGHALRPARPYDPPASASDLFASTALFHYRHGPAEIAVGRDQMPSGLNLPDQGIFIKARNRLGYYDAPTQVKAFVTGRRFQLVPFLYAPGGHDPAGEAEHGGGALAEFDVFGTGGTVVGLSTARGIADHGERQMIGGYARLGFGRWGIFAEHDVTDRTRPAQAPSAFRQHATYGEVFWALREWLVASAVAERLTVAQPFAERLASGKIALGARLTPEATIGISAKVQRDLLTTRMSTSVVVQAAIKTVR